MKKLKGNLKEKNVLEDITLLGKAPSSTIYEHLKPILVAKWQKKESLNCFVEYFNNCLILSGDSWAVSNGYEYRTNNHIQGYNSALKTTIGFERKRFANIFKFLNKKVKAKSADAEVKISSNRVPKQTERIRKRTMKAFKLKNAKGVFIQMKKDCAGLFLIVKKETFIVEQTKIKQIININFTDWETYKYLRDSLFILRQNVNEICCNCLEYVKEKSCPINYYFWTNWNFNLLILCIVVLV
uniref:DDE_Tnp_ISL3 domain-containing protein n=1 Tax=Rhabditophanes sp. KR3021 TaxID=114890 RepID=A0AC35UGY4_9BILA